MIAEVIDTVWTLGWALAAWFVLCAVFATLALYTVAVAVWWPCRAAREGIAGALAASQALRALGSHPERYRPRSRPLWAATQSDPSTVEEAA